MKKFNVIEFGNNNDGLTSEKLENFLDELVRNNYTIVNVIPNIETVYYKLIVDKESGFKSNCAFIIIVYSEN